MKELMSCMKAYRAEAILSPLFKLCEACMELLVPLVVAMIVDVGIATGDVTYIVTRCLILVAFGVAGLAFALTAQFFAAKAAVGASAELRRRLFEKLQSFSYTQIDDMGTATMITRMTSDVNQVQAGVNMTLRLLLRSPIVVLGATVMAFIVDWAAALVFVAVTPLLAAAVVGIMTATVPMYKKVQGEMDGVYLSTRENLAGVRVIRAFCKEADEEREFAQRNAQLRRRQKRAGRIAALTNPLTYALVSVAAIALVWVGGARVAGGVLLQGDVVALYSYLSIILVELVKFANLIFTASKAISCEKRIEAVLAKEGEPDVLHPAKDGWSADAPAFSFEDVTFAYHGGGHFPYQFGRLEHGYVVRSEPKDCISKEPAEYLRQIYFDTITHSTPALQFLADTFGVDHVLIGTDMPYDMGDLCPVQTVNSLRLTASERAAICSGNAVQLFGIE